MTTLDQLNTLEQAELAEAITQDTTAQTALLEALQNHLVTKCSRYVKRFEGFENCCVMQVIGVQGPGDQPWVPALLMSHALPKESRSAESASHYQQWAFRFEMPQVTSTRDLSAVLNRLAPRLDNINSVLSNANTAYGWVDNNVKIEDIETVFDTDTLNLVDSTGLEFILCPNKDSSIDHVRRQNWEVNIAGPLEDWVGEWADQGGASNPEDAPEMSREFLENLRPDHESEEWHHFDADVNPRVVTVDGVEVLNLEIVEQGHIPLLEDFESDTLWLSMAMNVADRHELGMSARSFYKLVSQGKNPFAHGFKESDLEEEDLQMLELYRKHIDRRGTYQEAHDSFVGRAATKAELARKNFDWFFRHDDMPKYMRACINWDSAAEMLQAEGTLRFFEFADSTWAFTTCSDEY